jgi:hypothetical protein
MKKFKGVFQMALSENELEMVDTNLTKKNRMKLRRL